MSVSLTAKLKYIPMQIIKLEVCVGIYPQNYPQLFQLYSELLYFFKLGLINPGARKALRSRTIRALKLVKYLTIADLVRCGKNGLYFNTDKLIERN
jgi:hypothetical protein